MTNLFEGFLSTAEVTQALSDGAVIEAMLRFEAALARAQSSAGVIPLAAAQSIIGTCKVDLFDVPKIARESASLRCLATPVVNSLRETVALFNREAADFVHFGCTNRDLVDTALALVARNVLDLIEADLAQIIGSLLALAGRHAGDATLARSPSSNPSVTSFGLICCQWAAPLVRSQQRLQSGACHGLSLHLGSTTSTLADVQDSDTLVVALMASELELKAPVFSGHVTGDETVALACELGLLVGNLGKIASDMAYLVACAAGELTLYGSCAVPSSGTKPLTSEPISTGCMVALAGAQRVPQQVAVMLASLSQGHGNALGSWHAQLAQWPALLATSQSVTRAMAQIMVGLQVDTRRMRSNLDVVRTCVNGKEAKIRLSADWAAQAVAMTDRQIHTLLAPQKPT